MFIANHSVKVDFFEGYVVGTIEAKHNHTSYPKEKDILTCLHHRGRVEVLEIITFSTKVCCSKWPLSRWEPRIKRILLLLNLAATLCTHGNSIIEVYHTMMTIDANFSGNRNAPSYLTGNWPIFNIGKPVTEDSFVTLSYKGEFTCIKSMERFLRERLHVHKPLLFYLRLNFTITFVAARYCVFVLFINSNKKTLFVNFLNNLLSSFANIHSSKFSSNRQKLATPVNNLFVVEVVTLSDFKVDGWMPRCDCHYTRTHFWITGFVFDNSCGDWAIDPL